ncbi:DUF2235 domain-containing protein [Salipiger mangrovisoli]|uniref:DUF2235 domain-containing protein n=1 Tax=Salipiger mangrovisoli TaxID=2865933 RepID=A0ABR9X1M0_9RHOB|nr:DUF2235 domain-containing protein [Salipiger mangrovisoli]MBE9637370.1 DUF2235 domain-containing protein [Salipiger mangrovisoli]
MAKNIVICCDGTGNEIGETLSNVLKLYRCVPRDAGQRVFYDPGVGTLSSSDSWAEIRQSLRLVFGLATGWGLDDNILEPYQFLVEHWQKGDRIFLFGFSRGAYTVRALAGMIYLVGLLSPEQRNLSGPALVAYKRASSQNSLRHGWRVRQVLRTRRVPIHFLGAWDTVSSVIVPRPDRLYLPSFQKLPYTRSNPGVRAFRHALSIDERRRMFRLNRWVAPSRFNPDPFGKTDLGHSTKQVWFAGTHSDVGGGWPEPRSGLSRLALRWMIDEAVAEGLRVDARAMAQLIPAPRQPDRSGGGAEDRSLAEPVNASMIGLWPVLEYLPKCLRFREWPFRRGFARLYLPRGEPRPIPPDADLHPSVVARMQSDPGYRPENLAHRVDDPKPSAPAPQVPDPQDSAPDGPD